MGSAALAQPAVRERPILFSGPMVRAILDGRKRQTRRAVSPRFLEPFGEPSEWEPQHYATWRAWCHHTNQKEHFASPYGQPGDRLWVRETWRTSASLDNLSPAAIAQKALDANYVRPWAPLLYVQGGDTRNWDPIWGAWGKTRVSIHLPRWASRLTLEVVRVRVERLQDITEADAIAEGIATNPVQAGTWMDYPEGSSAAGWRDPRQSFASLWRSINGAESWDANPWVWVVDFRRTEARHG